MSSRQRVVALLLGSCLACFWNLPLQAWIAPLAKPHGNSRKRLSALRAVQLSRTAGGEDFLKQVPSEHLEALEAAQLELSLPDKSEIEELTMLMHESFERIFEKKRMQPEGMGPLGVLGEVFNAFTDQAEVQEISKGLLFRLDLTMQFPSLQKPIRQEQTLALQAKLKGSNELVAYVELCMLVPDGRRPDEDDEDRPIPDGLRPKPYLSNLCVTSSFRRKGLARAVLQVAEDIVRYAWKEEEIYLHIDSYEPSRKLYESSGYTTVSSTTKEGDTHMVKELATIEDEKVDDFDEEEDDVQQEEEDPDEDWESGQEMLALGPGRETESTA
eukprot:TRINITY_DN22718_c0_g1_i1.p1 TRINITY_DN22718_c0_g1~~TRINITY_DN22718_c0_g1_i1.p1  ORF type:complete len:340 (+),score=94.37 TRINITY_DN22718_c0_g1_i1:37-1020(+)